MNYLIGGSARCGKSTLARSIRESTGIQTLSGDALRTTMRKTCSPEIMPLLHQSQSEKIKSEQNFVELHLLRANDEITVKRKQASFVWPFIQNYLRAIEHESGDDIVVDSIDIWPDLIATSSLRHRAVFLLDTSTDQADRIIASRGADSRDWMHANHYSDAMISAWSHFNAERSQMIRDLSDRRGYFYVDLADTSFEQGQKIALNHLQS